jgi:hypothetical protein
VSSSSSLLSRWWAVATVLSVAAVGFAQLLVQLLGSRVLGPDRYAQAAVVLAVMTLCQVPLTSFQHRMTTVVLEGGDAVRWRSRVLRRSGVFGVAVGVAGVVWLPLLDVESWWAAVVAAVFVPVAAGAAMARGEAAGSDRQSFLLARGGWSAAGVRAVVGVAGALVAGVPGLLLSAVAAEAVWWVLCRQQHVPFSAPVQVPPQVRVWPAPLVPLTVLVCGNADLFWVRLTADVAVSGRYALVSGLSFGVASLGTPIGWLVVKSSLSDPRAVVRAVLVAGVVCSVAATGTALAAPFVIATVSGEQFADLGAELWLLCAAAVPIGMAAVAAATLAATVTWRHVWWLAAAAACAVSLPALLTALWGYEPYVFAVSCLVSSSVAAVTLLGCSVRSRSL